MKIVAAMAAALVAASTAFAPAQVAVCSEQFRDDHESTSVYSFDALSVVDRNNVWATGESEDTYFSHWDGEQWKPVFGPEPQNGQFNLRAISGVVHNDIWAVGSAGFDNSRAVILHRNVKAWATVRIPRVGRQSVLEDVVALADGTAFAVGAYSPRGEHELRPLVYRYDGVTWQRERTGLRHQRFGLTDVAGDPAYGLWVVPARSGLALFRTPAGGWTKVRLGRSDALLRDVAMTPEGSAWFVADAGGRPLVYRRITRWTRFEVPDLPYQEYLEAIDGMSDSNVWAVGYRITGDTGYPYAIRLSPSGVFEYVEAANPTGWIAFRDVELDETGGVWAAAEIGTGGIVERAC